MSAEFQLNESIITVDRRRGDRRGDSGLSNTPKNSGNVDKRKKDRRRQIDPTTCERDYTNDEVEFMKAIDNYKRKTGRSFPNSGEVLEVVANLGYVQAEKDANATESFVVALDTYKRKNCRMFPTCSEILEVIRSLGYSKPFGSTCELAVDDSISI